MSEKVPGLKAGAVKRELPFSVQEFKKRQANVRKLMAERDLDVLVVNTPENMYYLSGYNTPGYYTHQCLMLPANGDPIIVCRATEEMNVFATSCLDRSDSYADDVLPVQRFAETLEKDGFSRARIGVEKISWFLTVANYEKLQTMLPDAKFVDGSMLVERCRVIKSPAEIALIRKAGKIATASLEAAYGVIREGVTEDDVAAEVNRVATAMGGEWPGLPPFVCSGVRTSFTHATYAGRRLEKGDPVLLELPGVTKRYGAAIMRTPFVGGKGPKHIQKMYDTSRRALEAHLKSVKPGRTPGEVWNRWAKVLKDAGHAETYRRAGYSIGINYPPDWGEGYIIGFQRGENRPLEPNMTFHVPSLVKHFGVANVGFSETIRVTNSGCEVLTETDDGIQV
ncbi:MAG: aminopeptidase P family protein [Rhodospirillales bacterium]|nr:aminopeptidase P family protein [Rhodospirillales bacterium]